MFIFYLNRSGRGTFDKISSIKVGLFGGGSINPGKNPGVAVVVVVVARGFPS